MHLLCLQRQYTIINLLILAPGAGKFCARDYRSIYFKFIPDMIPTLIKLIAKDL